MGSICAAVPLCAPRRTVGLLLLYKDQGASFSTRELDLWMAAAGQLAVAVENARLPREAQATLRVREEFMSIASHELKTPLTPLKLSLFTMERRLATGLLVNLLENAHQYSPAGELITVEVEEGGEDARIHVKDHGIGIPGADQAPVFQRFYRARPPVRERLAAGVRAIP